MMEVTWIQARISMAAGANGRGIRNVLQDTFTNVGGVVAPVRTPLWSTQPTS